MFTYCNHASCYTELVLILDQPLQHMNYKIIGLVPKYNTMKLYKVR
jgi:hypothetical protein